LIFFNKDKDFYKDDDFLFWLSDYF